MTDKSIDPGSRALFLMDWLIPKDVAKGPFCNKCNNIPGR